MRRSQPPPRGPILSSREVAETLDLSPDVVNELARRRELRAFKEGRFWRFRQQDVLDFRERRHGPDAAPDPPC